MTPGDPEDADRWVQDALDEAVADVEPRHDLHEIRARLEEESARTRKRRRWGAAAAGLAVAATVATVAFAAGLGVGDPTDEAVGPADSPSASEEASDGTLTPSEEGSTPAESSSGSPVAVYYVGDTPTGPRLFREFRAPDGEGDALNQALRMALATAPLDPDYRTPWPALDVDASFEDGVLTVDLLTHMFDMELVERRSDLPRDEARMALQQLIHTAQAAVQERAPVRFLIDGRPTDRLLGEQAAEPLKAGDPMQVQAPVWITSPQDGIAVRSLQVEGRGAFFEANVSWQVLDGDRVVKEGFATAEECCRLAAYSFEMPDLPPGDYVLRVYDADMSGGEDPGEQEDTKLFTVTG